VGHGFDIDSLKEWGRVVIPRLVSAVNLKRLSQVLLPWNAILSRRTV